MFTGRSASCFYPLAPAYVGLFTLVDAHESLHLSLAKSVFVVDGFKRNRVCPGQLDYFFSNFFWQVTYCLALLTHNGSIASMRRLWNRPDLPIWSLVTIDTAGQANMNICTYVTSVSLKPKRMAVAVYHDTKTLANLQARPDHPVLLQLLTSSLAPVVRVCGQQSGKQIDKISRLQKRYGIAYRQGLPYLAAAAGYLVLVDPVVTPVSGDHTVYTFSVAAHKNLQDQPILTTEQLRQQKYIR